MDYFYLLTMRPSGEGGGNFNVDPDYTGGLWVIVGVGVVIALAWVLMGNVMTGRPF